MGVIVATCQQGDQHERICVVRPRCAARIEHSDRIWQRFGADGAMAEHDARTEQEGIDVVGQYAIEGAMRAKPRKLCFRLGRRTPVRKSKGTHERLERRLEGMRAEPHGRAALHRRPRRAIQYK